MVSISLHKSQILGTITDFLIEAGAPVQRYRRLAKLPQESLERDDLLISSRALWSYLGIAARNEGVQNIGLRTGRARVLGKCFPTQLIELPTLYRGLELTSATLSQSSSGSHIYWHRVDGDTLRLCHHPTFGKENPNLPIVEWFALGCFMDIVRHYTGPQWQPQKIGLMSSATDQADAAATLPGVHCSYGNPTSFIDVEVAHLSASPQSAPTTETDAEPANPPVPRALVDSLKQLVTAYFPEGAPPIETIAEVIGTSARSLQRELQASGYSYRRLLQSTRYDAAIRLLDCADLSIGDIALKLGYREPTHFARAFRREAGVSPRQYRQKIRQNGAKGAQPPSSA